MAAARSETVKFLMQKAASFREKHAQDAAVGATFGYFTHHPVAPVNRKRLALILEAVDQERARLSRPLRILDVACGGGIITCAMAAIGHRALGVDLNAQEIRMAKLFASEQKLDGMFIATDVLKDTAWQTQVEQILGGRPDVVTLAYALHHLPEVEKFLSQLSQWLPQNAALVVNEENPESPLFRLKHRVRTWIQKDTETEWHRTLTGWQECLEKNGFTANLPPRGADAIPGLAHFSPEKCWSLVFTARRR